MERLKPALEPVLVRYSCHPERAQRAKDHKVMQELTYFVYIITNPVYTVLYIGVTNDLERRMYEHKQKFVSGFASKYNCTKLVYFDTTEDVVSAIEREKELKGWVRRKKIALIENENPNWRDLSEDF